jgi:two-component system CheB/CheR fusion protein
LPDIHDEDREKTTGSQASEARDKPAPVVGDKPAPVVGDKPAEIVGDKPAAIVGMGASAGGIPAFREFFENLPGDSGMAFVVILHLPPDRRSLLVEILSRWTPMSVVDVADDQEIRANHVYVPPPGSVVEMHQGRLLLRDVAWQPGQEHTPINIFFDSLAADQGEDAVGIVLSGTGTDGTLGLRVIKDHGGLTLAQGGEDRTSPRDKAASDADPDAPAAKSPQFPEMPQGAIASGAVDIVLPAGEMPGHLLRVLEQRTHSGQLAAGEDTDALRLAICDIMRSQVGHDFSHYKERTFLRRVQRRMQVVGLVEISAYIERLRKDRAECLNLLADLLISVTSFFRDIDTFRALENIVIPRLFTGKTADDTVRVWVVGCATGEEAYSLAILLCEHTDRLPGAPRVQVFATDIDEPAISTARAGRYTASLLEGMSPARRTRFFTPSGGAFVVKKEIRDLCTFSSHSLTRDPPFSRIDMVSCRNLLIYLDGDMQDQVMPAFHYSLVPGGVLFLGTSESASRHENLFEPLDRQHRIYRRVDGPSPPLALPGRGGKRSFEAAARPSQVRDHELLRNRTAEDAAARVLHRYGPPFVVVTATGDIVHYSSRTGAYLEPPQGLPSRNVMDQARRGLLPELRNALREVVQTNRRVERPRVSFLADGHITRGVTLVLEPMREQAGGRLYLIVFIEPSRRQADAGAPTPVDFEPVATAPAIDDTGIGSEQLDHELRETREQLRSVMEEHDTALEELRSANEELNSLNEEMQSTNEELETSKEEIQSVNEELQTVNVQLSGKVEELDRTNSDIRNLFESTQVATVFLDPHLVIRGFTPAIAGIYNLIPSDHGRPLTDIASRLRYDTLHDDVTQVLQTLQPLERRVTRSDEGAHYLMRILPYRAQDSRVDGTLITFVDVTSIVQAERHQRLLVDELNHRVKNMLTVVISLAAQTLRRASSLEDFSTTFLGRVESLTAAYALLSRENWSAVSLQDVLMEGLKPYIASDHANIALSGPPVSMPPRGALALGMALHELATNAVRHGALSVPEGRVAITWKLEQHDEMAHLRLEWIESNGPKVEPPTRRGFGMTLIERSLPHDLNGTAQVEFAPEGVRATLHARMATTPEAIPAIGGISQAPAASRPES